MGRDLPAPGTASRSQAPARHLAAQRQGARPSARLAQLRQPGGRRHRALRDAVVAHARGRFPSAQQTIARYGAAAIPQDSSLVDWPVGYAELELFYDKAEYELGISGKAGNLQGRKIDGGNVFEAARRRDYPLPPLLMDQSGTLPDQMEKSMEKDFWALFEKWRLKKGVDLFKDSGRPASTPHDEL